MAIEPKKARKRPAKKSAAKASKVEAVLETGQETTTTPDIEVEAPVKPARAKAVPVPMFQAAPETKAPAKKVAAKKNVSVSNDDSSDSADDGAVAGESEEQSAERRRRRRGGRGRRRTAGAGD